MAKKEIKDRLVAEFEAKIAEINVACTNGTSAEVDNKINELKAIESQYLKVREKEVFASCEDVHDALITHTFVTKSHKKDTKDGVMVGVLEAERVVQIDLKSFCEYKGLPLKWFYHMQALNKRLTLKVATDLGMSAEEIKEIDDSYAMDKLAGEIELGKTPTSKTQCVSHMQEVLDMLSEGEGRVNNHDLQYVMLCYGKKSNKNALRVICSKHSILQSLLTTVFHRVATNGAYGVEYKTKSVDEVSQPEQKAAKPVKSKKASAKDDEVVVKKEVAA